MVSITRCDDSEITEMNDTVRRIVHEVNIIDIFSKGRSDWPDFIDIKFGLPYCTYDYNARVFGELFHCERDDKIIPDSMICIYALDASGYLTGCRSGDHLQNCENFICPENTVKCPGSYCIEQRFLCDGHIECPGGEDEHDCTCTNSDKEVILFVEDSDSESEETAMHLAKQFFTSTEKSIVRLFYFKRLHSSIETDITDSMLEIRKERVNSECETECKYETLPADLLKNLQFSKSEKRAIIMLENSDESSIVTELALSNLSEPVFSIYRVIKDFSLSLYKTERYKFVKDIHIRTWSSLFSTGFRRFPEICTEASYVPCAGMYRCSSSKQCIPLKQLCDKVIHCNNGDDELLCDSVCPPKCNCTGDFINCRAADISISDISSLTIKARSADLSKNKKIKEIYKDNLRFPFMLRLNISSCDIHHIDKQAFYEIQNLLSLDLSSNRIRELSDRVFSRLGHLTYLNLESNFELEKISSTAFKDLKALRNIRISGTNLKKISSFTFSGLQLESLDISNNKIEEIEDNAFSNSLVRKINFEGNNVISFGKFMLNGVTSLQELHTPAFKFCCIVRPSYVPEENCKPLRNEFSSCDDLMRNSVLQAVLWIVGVASLCGNLSSIIYRLVYDRERLKIGYGIFVTNLAAADFLMGVYLIIIAIADSLYRNRY
ncbi:G-protein coupled receptor GRL101-like [Ruditapes philippinarum]|uniref:G-protein coupled receptor GRL101-like n=1 Tax=Ruditapes philippinarum TaxID=129788 RepID=UPI00295ABC20|nr:G-protein coupled receptor GRL101-like [Ruditapes philippinarum]